MSRCVRPWIKPEYPFNRAFEVCCFVLMKCGPASGLSLTSTRQPTKKRESEGQVKREKSAGTLRQPQLIACTTQCSKTADENMSV